MIIGQINLRMWTRQGHRHRVVMAFSLSGAGTSHGRAIAYKGQPRGGRRATTGGCPYAPRDPLSPVGAGPCACPLSPVPALP